MSTKLVVPSLWKDAGQAVHKKRPAIAGPSLGGKEYSSTDPLTEGQRRSRNANRICLHHSLCALVLVVAVKEPTKQALLTGKADLAPAGVARGNPRALDNVWPIAVALAGDITLIGMSACRHHHSTVLQDQSPGLRAGHRPHIGPGMGGAGNQEHQDQHRQFAHPNHPRFYPCPAPVYYRRRTVRTAQQYRITRTAGPSGQARR